MDNETKRFNALIGVVVIVNLAVGFLGLLGAAFALFSAAWIGVGACLAASALAFGLTANAILRS